MASILRSSKFVRYIAGFARNVVVNTPREFDGNFINTATAQCYCGAVPRTLATQTSSQYDQNLERRLRTLDQDVRKSGRVSRRDIEDVLEEIQNARSASSSQSLLVIRCCGSLVPEELPEVRTKLVEEIWSTLNRLNVPMDVSHYNALLRVYLENEHPFSPTEFLSDMESKGIEPNRVTYQRLISRYCQEGDIEGATKILEYMREKQMPVNENVFNALIFGHSQAGDMDSAHGILTVMAQAGLEPSADTYTTLLCGYGRNGNIKAINELLAECEVRDIYLLDKDYLDIVYSLATNGYSQYVPDILAKVQKNIGYNQDASNLILRLINKGCESTAFEVMKTMSRSVLPNGSLMPIGNFFIRQLVKAEKPIETILSYCKQLEEENMYDKGLLLATETSLELGKEELSYALLEQLHKNGFEIRQHYFWPLILLKAKDSSGNGILQVLKNMQSYDLLPSSETMREYILPNLNMKSSEILEVLRDANIPLGTSVSSVIINLLQKHEISEAATIAAGVRAYYNPELLKKPLTNALQTSGDVDSYVSLLRTIYDNLENITKLNETFEVPDKSNVLGSLVLELVHHSKNFSQTIPLVLEKLVEQGLSISTEYAEKIESKLGEKMTDCISDLLGKLTSGDLTPVPLKTNKPIYTPFNQMSIPQLERLIQNLTSKNQETIGLKKHLFTLYYRDKNLEGIEKLFEDLKKDPKFEGTAGIYAQLLDAYASNNKLDKALEQLDLIKKIEGENFQLDESKIVRLAAVLVDNGQFENAIRLLEDTPKDRNNTNRGYAYNSQVWRFLNSLAEKGRTTELYQLFDTLVKNDYIDVNNILLGPLIRVHIVNNELDTAIEKLEWCVNQFKATPWKNELTCRLIQLEDAEKLQKLTDLSTVVHGEINSLYDLVFAFVECGRVRQARKILETPGLQSRPKKINFACERFQQEGLITPLEGLKDATRDLNYIDRTDIYYQLLLSYIKQGEPEKCLNLWTQMQEEDLAPTNQFLLTLGSFLQEKGIEVPFVVPQPQIQARPQETTHFTVRPVENSARTNQNIFKQKLQKGDIDGSLQIAAVYHDNLSINDISRLIEKLIHNDRLNDATSITLKLLDKDKYPVQKIFRFLLNRLASAGDIHSLEQIGNKLNASVKKLVSFDNRLCHANIVAGKGEDYLNKLEKDIDSTNSENLSIISGQFPRGGAYGILEHHPNLTDKYEQIAIKYASKGIVGPLNVLWTKYFISNKDEKATQIWNEYLKDSPRIMFQKIVQTARETQDEHLIQKLINHLKISNVTEGATGNAYSCYLDVLIAKNKSEEVVNVFEKALTEIDINNINRTAVLRVKEVYEKLGKEFSHPIPTKNKFSNGEEE
ncbi:leucine-rich PPR motif-containing protein, mitochondrial [Sitophilus oryzae]|uniref:Leucine-rich PPR motif-containing protein, mitochondrial n=1 Tax=Sitophilus oryzae TaxID=7048 RepID=A0A6J2YK65_SITOR|nr:leucine-rich PPR motif-containing protein, mitochondrial [Sitophilus oryzae]